MIDDPKFLWMRHGEHGGVAQVPGAAREAYEALGWIACDEPPPLPDPVLVQYEPLKTAEPETEEPPTSDAPVHAGENEE